MREITLKNLSLFQLAQNMVCARICSKNLLMSLTRDAIFMEHRVGYVDASAKDRKMASQLVLFGHDIYSAMAKTVGLAAAIGYEEILNNKTSNKLLRSGGLLIPNHRELYQPMLQKLENEGIVFKTLKF